MTEQQNYVLGRGRVYFAPFTDAIQTAGGERYLGNTPAFALNISADNLDHFSSDQGIKEKDDSVVLQTTRTGTLTTDNIDPENVALFFFGDAQALAIAAATITDEPIADVVKGMEYQLGMTTANPSGARGLIVHTAPSAKIILKKASATLVEGTDYSVDMALGRVTILTTGTTISDLDDLTVSYKIATQTRTRIISGSQAIEGALRFISTNPKGKQIDYYLPWVKLTPNGDYALKGDDWQSIAFNVEALRKTGYEAIYADTRAA